MKFASSIPSFVCVVALFSSCGLREEADSCCHSTRLPPTVKVRDGEGLIQVNASTSGHFYVFDENGAQVGHQSFNQGLAVTPGAYDVAVNASRHRVRVREAELTQCYTGTLLVTGNTGDFYYLADSSGAELAHETLGKSMAFFPGRYTARVNRTGIQTTINAKELTEIKTGTLIVRGTTHEYYYVLDDQDGQLNYSPLGKPLAFLPGTYPVKVNKTTTHADILPGKTTELLTGTVMVKGLTDEYYYVTDTVGNALNYQTLNKPLALFPGDIYVRVNNTRMRGTVAAGEITSLVTGSLMLRGVGNQYYHVLDSLGNRLNSNSLNRSLSFFPSAYQVNLGSHTQQAIVEAGELTAIDAGQ